MTRLPGLRHLLVFEDCARGPDRGIGSVGMLHRPRCGLRRVTRHDAFLPRSVLDPPGAAVVAGPVRRALDVRHLDLRAHRTPDHGRSFPDHRDSWRRRAGGALGHGSVATREPQVRACCFSVLRFTADRFASAPSVMISTRLLIGVLVLGLAVSRRRTLEARTRTSNAEGEAAVSGIASTHRPHRWLQRRLDIPSAFPFGSCSCWSRLVRATNERRSST